MLSRLVAALSRRLAMARPPTVRKAVLVVHGIGEEAKGDTLRIIANALARFLEARLGAENVTLEAHLGEQAGPARASLTFRHRGQGRRKEERWDLVEVWWARAFRPPTLPAALRWSFWQLWDQTWWTLRGLTRILRGRHVAWRRTVLPDKVVVPSSPLRDWPIILYDALAAAFWVVAFALGSLVVVPLLVLLWALTQLPVGSLLPGLLRAVRQAADYLLVAYVGDVVAYLEDPTAAADVRGEFAAALRSLDDGGYDGVYVLAHSWGAVVAFDALSQMDQSQRVDKLITVGAGLNRARRAKSALQRARLPESLRWVDIHARYDIVPAGPTRGATLPRLVSNQDSVLADHVTYWENAEEVLSLLADEIEDGSPPTAFRRSEREMSDDGRERKRRLLPLSLLRLAAWGWPLAFFFLLSLDAFGLRVWFVDALLDKPVVQTPITWFANLSESPEGLEPKPLLMALGNEGRARWALGHLALPAVGLAYVGAGSFLAFRFVRDILWGRMMELGQRRWHRRRREREAG